MTDLVNNLGGTAGFGENSLARNDDNSTSFIDLRSVFGNQGINFFGHDYTGLYLNNNGSVTFSSATSAFTPSAITGATSNPIIAPFWADVDTRGGTVTPTPGGTSTGSNLLWYDLDPTTKTFTATWDDVGYYNTHTNKLNAFQLSIQEIDAQGDFDITFRYEAVNWVTGDASGGSNGLGGTVAHAGYSAGDGIHFFELTQSGNQSGMLGLAGASNVGVPGTFVFEVLNGSPTAAISISNASIVEGNSGQSFVSVPVFLTQAASATVTVQYATHDGTATAGQDYQSQSGTLTFTPGVTQQNILIPILGDTTFEPDETFTVTLSNPSAGSNIINATGTVTIQNDDASLSIAVTDAVKLEGNSGSTPFTFTVTRSGYTGNSVSVNWAVSGAAVSGADFTGGVLPSGTVTFGVGESSKVITINVAGDIVVEPDEAFSVTLSNPSAASVTIGTASAQGLIENDDASLSIAATDAVKLEGNAGSTPFTFTVTRTGDTASAVSAQWSVSGAAVNGADFQGGSLPSGIVSFAAGQTTQTITVNVAGDTVIESDEAFTVTLSNPSVGAVIGTAQAQGLIENDDGALSIAATDADKAEGNSGSTAFTFTVTRSGDTGDAASVQWAVGGSAVNGADFTGGALPSGTLNFAAGETSQVITVNVAGDTVVEPDETFTVTLSNPSAGVVIDTASATGTIRNDDASLSIAAANANKAEGDFGATAFTFTVTRTGDTESAVSANWDVSGAAVDGSDFLPLSNLVPFAGFFSLLSNIVGGFFPDFTLFDQLPSGTVNFASGQTSQTITVWVLGDSLAESDENFTVTLSDPSAGAVIGTASAVGTIRNDDSAPGASTGPVLSFQGAPVAPGQFGAWAPIAMTPDVGGYEVAFRQGTSDRYSVWTTDLAGNMLTNPTGVVSGASYTLQSFEPLFHQDLNNDGRIGPVARVIEQAGAAALVQVADRYALGSASGSQLGYGGAPVTAGQFGAWTAIGAEAISSGYEVAWRLGSSDQYIVWNTDTNGNMVSMPTGVVSGESWALQSLEPSFHQDLNGDGMIGAVTTLLVQSMASSLVDGGGGGVISGVTLPTPDQGATAGIISGITLPTTAH